MGKEKINLGSKIDEDFIKNNSEFPYQIFPKAIQYLIENANKTVGFNKEYLSAGILSTAATAIGNTTRINNGSYYEKPILWQCIVGRSGIGKTHPLNFAKKPLEDKDKLSYLDYKNALQVYDQQESKCSKPKYNTHILKDFTPEKLADNLQFNEKGVIIFKDELIGWINRFDQYNKGGDQQLYLELFNGGTLSVDRVTKDPIRVEETNVNIIGGLQPKVLKNLGANNRNEDGFLARFLFVYPKNPAPFLFTGNSIEKRHVDNYINLINNLYDAPTRDLKTTQETNAIYMQWQHEKVKEYHNDDFETLIQAKLQTYVWRFALILECMSQANCNVYSDSVSNKSMSDAIILAEYYRKNAIKVSDRMLVSNPLEELPIHQFNLFKALPSEFKRIEVLPLFEEFEVKGGSINRFLKSKLFSCPKYGYYKKK
jgi:hypothetical protein